MTRKYLVAVPNQFGCIGITKLQMIHLDMLGVNINMFPDFLCFTCLYVRTKQSSFLKFLFGSYSHDLMLPMVYHGILI